MNGFGGHGCNNHTCGCDKQQEVIYRGATNEQVNWGSNDDPRPLLRVGSRYILKNVDEHSWHTKYELVEFPGLHFNSVSFELVQ